MISRERKKQISISIKIFLLTVICVLVVFACINYKDNLVVIKNLPKTITRQIDFDIDNNKLISPLHQFTFIEKYDIYLQPCITYFTLLDKEQIEAYFSKQYNDAMENYKLCNTDEDNQIAYIFYDNKNKQYIIIPKEYNIEYKNKYINKVYITLIDKDDIQKIISQVNANE